MPRPLVCPGCAQELPTTRQLVIEQEPDPRPLLSPGQQLMCLYCSALLQVDGDGTPRPMTEAEFFAIPRERLEIMHEVWRKFGKRPDSPVGEHEHGDQEQKRDPRRPGRGAPN